MNTYLNIYFTVLATVLGHFPTFKYLNVSIRKKTEKQLKKCPKTVVFDENNRFLYVFVRKPVVLLFSKKHTVTNPKAKGRTETKIVKYI